MIRTYNERRNRRIIVMVLQKGVPPKEVARRLNMSWSNVRTVLFRSKRSSVFGPNTDFCISDSGRLSAA